MRIPGAICIIALTLFTAACILPAYGAEAVKSTKMPAARGKDAIETRFLNTADEIIKKQKELNVTDEQVVKIKELITLTLNEIMQRNAGIDAITVEINTISWESPFDMDPIEKLALEKQHLIAEKDKSVIGSYKKLSQLLTDEQREALKNSR